MTRYWLLLLLCTVGCGSSPSAMVRQPNPTPDPPVVSSPPPVTTPPPVANPSVPADWTLIDLVPLDGMSASQANAVNSSGMAAGYSVDAAQMPHATIWDIGGTPVQLGPGIAMAINDSGAVVGYWVDDTQAVHAQMWRDGFTFDLGNWLPTALNNSGVVVGIDTTNNTAVEWSQDGGLAAVPSCSAALTVNNHNQIAGISNQLTASICGGTDYQMPGAVVAISDSGMAVGYQDLGNNQADALVFPSTDIDTSGLATGVNQWGWVVGEQITQGVGNVSGMDINQRYRGLLDRGVAYLVGKPGLAGNSQPFIWSADTGLVFLPSPLITATGISGKFIVGAGLAADGQSIHGILLEGK